LQRIADPAALSGIAVQHADDGYSRYGYIGDILVQCILLMNLPEGTNMYGSRYGQFKDIGLL